jgi:hypothetical protein
LVEIVDTLTIEKKNLENVNNSLSAEVQLIKEHLGITQLQVKE